MRQPMYPMIRSMNGAKTICPEELPLLRMPTASPRRALNQRCATEAESTPDMPPAPNPTMTPQVSQNCHNSDTRVVPNRPTESRVSEVIMTRRGPYLSRTQPTTGAATP